MRYRLAILTVLSLAVTACTTTTVPTNPLEKRWNGKSAGGFFAAYGPPISDRVASADMSVYTWRGGFVGGRSCTVELTVDRDYMIKKVRAVSDRIDPKGGPTHCQTVLDAT